MSQEPAAAAPAAPPKSKKLLYIIVAALVLLGGGGGAYWMFFAPGDADAAAKAPEASAQATGVVSFDPFVVNLADPGTPRFLRVTLALVVQDEHQATEFEENEVVRMKVRSALLETLSQQEASRVSTPEGRTALKTHIIELATHNAEHMKVSDVLFSEFIVQ
jgi:flagellar FliL protein